MTLSELLLATNDLHDAIVRSVLVSWQPNQQVMVELDARLTSDKLWRRIRLTFIDCAAVRFIAPPFDGVVLEACLVVSGERLLFSFDPEFSRSGEAYQVSDVQNGSASIDCRECVIDELGIVN